MASGAQNPIADYNPASLNPQLATIAKQFNLHPVYTGPTIWDVVTIQGQQSPGYCEVGEWKRKHQWDQKTGKGTIGSTLTYVGRPAAKGEIKFYLWTGAHFVQWESFRQLFLYDPTKQTVQAVKIQHPSLLDIGITAVVTEEIGNIVHAGAELYTCTVSLIEFLPPPPKQAVATPTGAKAANSALSATGTNAPPPPDPTAPLQQKLAYFWPIAFPPKPVLPP